MDFSGSSCTLSPSEQQKLIHKLEIFKIQGTDKHGCHVLCITGKLFPARLVGAEALKKYLTEEEFPRLGETPFSVVYLNAGVKARENFPGILAVRSVYEAIPVNVKDHLKAVYYVHPGLLARLFLATFGRFLFGRGLYSKLKYVNRLGFLWNHVCRKEVEIPEYVYEHDEELEHPRPGIEYALESDHPRSAVDSPVSMYSLRCIA